MNRVITILAALIGVSACLAYADYTFEERGSWPKSWPAELEGLRNQSRTFEGPLEPLLHYAIPFTKRDEFEAAWPHLLKVKSPGAGIVLRRGPDFWLGKDSKAGVCIHTPPRGEDPVADAKKGVQRRSQTIWIELIVDGDVVDLNRIPLPPDTPITDERFKSDKKQ